MSNHALKTILYAEDEDDIRTIAQIALEDIGGFNIRYCANGNEALAAAREITADLMLLDVMMPGMDGVTTLRELRKIPHYESIPVIFMTAKIQSSEIAFYKNLGAIEVIAKPFDPMTLADQIKTAWNQHNE